ITQGQNSIMLPAGFGVPLASDEKIQMGLQAANRSTDQHRRIKIQCIFYFSKDKEVKKPMQALTLKPTSINVIRKKGGAAAKVDSNCSACVEASEGEDAPNDLNHMFMHNGCNGEVRSAHWVVPPGVHAYRDPISKNECPEFALNGPIRAAQVHVHPYCTS